MDGLTNSKVNTIPTTKKTDEEEKGNSEIVPTKRSKMKYGQSRSRPYYSRRCKMSDFLNTNINSLPDELVFEILVHLPAHDIYNAIMTVCFKWHKIIHTHTFVNTHLHRSTHGLLIQNRLSQPTQLTFMALSRQGRVELTRLNYEPKYEICCNSCNGLILERERENPSCLYITNPSTMQHFALPPIVSEKRFIAYALAYASLSMKYKVVIVFFQEKECSCLILTVGVDESWRPVQTQHLSLKSKSSFMFKPLTTEGFMHWVYPRNYVLTLNVETEIIAEYSVPHLSSTDNITSCHYNLGVKYLSMLLLRGGWTWEVWEMKPETGDWTKCLEGDDLKDRMGEITRWIGKRNRKFKASCCSGISLQAVGWLEYKEVLVFSVYSPSLGLNTRFCFAWNVRSKEIQFIELDLDRNVFLVHRNSLVWLDGC